jgi:hypothetical protein
MLTKAAKFHRGKVLATPGALRALEESGQEASFFLDRHAIGDWGEIDQEDAQLNDEALKDGSRIISAYFTLKGVRVWIITEPMDDKGQRAATTILLPNEY